MLSCYRLRFKEEERQQQPVALWSRWTRTKKTRTYSQFKSSPDGRYLAWVSNEMGQYRCGSTTCPKKLKRIHRREEAQLNGSSTAPTPCWLAPQRPRAQLRVREEGRAVPEHLHRGRRQDRTPADLLILEKVLSMDYSDDGRNIAFSAVREGRTDIYLYYAIGNRQEQLTDDQYDDLDPHFVRNSTAIVFSSDRTDDTLRANAPVALVNGTKDLPLRPGGRSNILKRLTNTPG